MKRVDDALEINPKLQEAMTAVFESAEAGDGDFCGEQREWHLPRLQRAAALLIELFPNHAFKAMSNAKSPHDTESNESACRHAWPRSGPRAFVCVNCGKHRDELNSEGGE